MDFEKYSATPLRPSRFAHFFARDDRAYAFNALTLRRVALDPRWIPFASAAGGTASERAESIGLELLAKLCDAEILVPVGHDERLQLEQIKSRSFRGPRVRVMVMHLTDWCNLNCQYCFVERQLPSDYARGMMSPETVRAAVATYARLLGATPNGAAPSVVLYGGEPLMNWKGAKLALEEIDRCIEDGLLRADTAKVMITNAVLVTDKIAVALKEHDVHVAVSLDGPRDVHDANRRTVAGKGSFDAVMRGIAILKKHGVDPTISSVMTNETMRDLEGVLDFLLGEVGTHGIGFNHVSIVPGYLPYDEEYEAAYADSLIRAAEYMREHYPSVYDRRMTPRVRNFYERNVAKADCTGCGEQISVSADGAIGVCQGFIGSRLTFDASVHDERWDPASDPVFQEWSRRSPLNMEECTRCSALSTCGGGCPRNAHALTGSIWNADAAFCHFAKKATEWMVWNTPQRDEVYLGGQ